MDWTTAHSQSHLFFNHLTQSDGISQTTNNVVYQDSRGFIWITSLDGLNRYDGRQIKAYKHRRDDPHSLPDNYLQSRIIEDGDGDLWFTTYEALVRYVRKADHFERITCGKNKGYFLAFMDPKQRLGLVVGGNKFCYYDTNGEKWDSLHLLPPPAQRLTPLFQKNGAINRLFSYGYDQPGIHFIRYDAAGSPILEKRFIGENGEPTLWTQDMLTEGDSVWAATSEGILLLLPNGKDWQLFPTPAGQPNKLAFFGKGKIMASFNGGGWQFFDKNQVGEGPQFRHDPNDRWSLASDRTYGVWEDRHGVIWTGVNGIGVDFTQPAKVKFNLLDLRDLWTGIKSLNGVFSLAEDRAGNVWCSSLSMGVFVVSKELKPVARYFKGSPEGKTLPGNGVFRLFFDRENRLWALTWSGLGLLEPGSHSFRPIAPGSIFINGIELSDGRILFTAFNGGIYQMAGEAEELTLQKLPQVSDKNAYTFLFENRKGLLYACRDLSHIEVRRPDARFDLDTSLLISGDVACFFEDPGSDTLWIGMSNGLVSLDQKTWQWSAYTEADGLPNDHVYAILGNTGDTLWLTTNRGIVLFLTKTRQFHTFDMTDGMQGFEFNTHGYLRRPNGEFWFAGTNGVNYFHPDSIRMLQTKPPLQFTRLLVNNVEVPHPACAATGATNISEVKKLVFDYDENTLNFEFAALEFSNPAKNQFSYMLKNYETGWTPASTQGFARYANLPPGKYTLMVKASNSDGVWSEPKLLEIVIRQPFWGQWWFLLVVISGMAALGYGVYRWRVGQLLRIERLRNQISTDLHDDIGATLSNVNILTTLIRQKLPADSEALPLLDRIEEEVQTSAESLDDIIWSINPKNDPLDRVLARMRRFATEVFEAKGIEGELRFPQEAKRLRLDMAKRRQFYLFFKEAINNLAKYSQCRNALIAVNYENKRLSVHIEDDGLGFDMTTVKEGGNGLLTMRQRAQNLHGKFELFSSPGQGTKVGISFPITEIRD